MQSHNLALHFFIAFILKVGAIGLNLFDKKLNLKAK